MTTIGIERDIMLPLILAIIAAVFVFFQYLRQIKSVETPYLFLLFSLKLGAILALLALMLRPYWQIDEPDPSAFRVCFLGDVSPSMSQKDCSGKSRIEALNAILPKGSTKAFEAAGRALQNPEICVFGERVRRHFGSDFEVMPGKTSIGDAIDAALSSAAGEPPGAIVLLSDGVSNMGESPIASAMKCAGLGVPVNCVGLGSSDAVGDLSISSPCRNLPAKKGELSKIPFTVRNDFSKRMEIDAELFQDGALLSKKRLEIAAGSSLDTAFDAAPLKSGRNVFLLKIKSGGTGDFRQENDIAFATLNASEPDTFKILYLGSRLDWNFKFIKMHCDESRQFKFDAIVKNGESNFFRTSVAEKIPADQKGFPLDTAILYEYDLIALDLNSEKYLPENYQAFLEKFVGSKGGGLLIFGESSPLSQDLLKLLPAKGLASGNSFKSSSLILDAPFIYESAVQDTLSFGAGLLLPEQSKFSFADSLKPGAKSFLSDKEKRVLACIQSYGAGKSAFFGLRSNWRWCMRSNPDNEKYKLFWDGLLVWMASGGKARLSRDFDGAEFAVNSENTISVKVLDKDYLPASDAKLVAMIKAPDSKIYELPLGAAPGGGGGYSAVFIPENPGEHEIELTAKFADGETLRTKGSLLAAHSGIEFSDMKFREVIMRDIARISGGEYFSFAEIGKKNGIRISANIPKIKRKIYLDDYFILPVLIFILLSLEWYLRRRIGLK